MNMLDRVIGYFAPSIAVKRAEARASLQAVNKLMGTAVGPYNAAKINRMNMVRRTIVKENEISPDQLGNLRAESWNLYRNNPSARKIVRSLEAKVIGRGLSPESLALDGSGQPHTAFRDRAKQLWMEVQSGFDSRGLPGKGGLSMKGLQKLALRSTILSGETLFRLRPVNASKQKAAGIPVPLALQMIDAVRLADDSEVPLGELTNGHTLFRGIELNPDGERVAYWLRTVPAYAAALQPGSVTRVPADKIGHLFIEEDIDQYRGVPWFAAAIIGIRDTSDLQYNVLKASAMAACVVGSYKKPTGASRLGLNASATPSIGTADGTDLTDADGNAITKIQPGMFVNVGSDGKFELHSPQQPNMNPEGFVQHLQRGTATAFPGIKASTITGDYRNSSFSSERSADNDTWPEVQDIQDWFANSFCQPIWESILRAAVMTDYFAGIVSAEEFSADPGRFCGANWQGPIALSINPRDDAEAAKARIQGFSSSLQLETQKTNTNWRDILRDAAEVYQFAKSIDLPIELVNSIYGVGPQDVIGGTLPSQTPANATQDAPQPRSLHEAYQREMADAET